MGHSLWAVMLLAANAVSTICTVQGLAVNSNAVRRQQALSIWQLRLKAGDAADDDETSTSIENGISESEIVRDLEKARQQFEEQIFNQEVKGKNGGPLQPTYDHSQLEKEHGIDETCSSLFYKERLQEMECQLLQSLQDSDDAIDLLVELWRNECGPIYAELLEEMENSCSPGLFQEEKELRSMIERFRQYTWVEPMVRLALLLFTRGQYDEAADWCQTALEHKPWHVEAAQLLLVIHLRRANYREAVGVARHMSIPDLRASTEHRRRKMWVQRQTQAAEANLKATRRAIATSVEQQRKSELDSERYVHVEECPIGEGCWG